MARTEDCSPGYLIEICSSLPYLCTFQPILEGNSLILACIPLYQAFLDASIHSIHCLSDKRGLSLYKLWDLSRCLPVTFPLNVNAVYVLPVFGVFSLILQ